MARVNNSARPCGAQHAGVFQEGSRDPHTCRTDVGRNLTRHHSRAATPPPGGQLSAQDPQLLAAEDPQLLAAADAAQLLATTTAHLCSCCCRTRDSSGSTSVRDASAHMSRQHTKCIIAKHLTSTAGLGLPSCAAGAAAVPLVRLSSCSLRPVFSAITVCSRVRRLLLSASSCDRRVSISTICSFLRSRDLRGVRRVCGERQAASNRQHQHMCLVANAPHVEGVPVLWRKGWAPPHAAAADPAARDTLYVC